MMDFKVQLSSSIDHAIHAREYSIDKIVERISRLGRLCVFGIGAISYPIVFAIRKFTPLQISFLCDNDPNKWGKTYHGDLTCISPSELCKYRDDVAVIITTQHYPEIYDQLTSKGFRHLFVLTEYRLLNNDYFKFPDNIAAIKQNALRLSDLLADSRSREILEGLTANWFSFNPAGRGYTTIFSGDQYFPPDIIKLQCDESFIDAGAYNGDTLLEFLRRTNHTFDSIYAFELDRTNFAEMQLAVGELGLPLQRKIRLFNLGLLDCEGMVGYETGGSGKQSTCVNIMGSSVDHGKVVRLDDVLGGEKVTFIKMDIEGSELRALHGARDLIERQKPKLAICVYHQPQHLWEIPFFLKELVPEYRIFLRHHTVLDYESVCYAIPE